MGTGTQAKKRGPSGAGSVKIVAPDSSLTPNGRIASAVRATV